MKKRMKSSLSVLIVLALLMVSVSPASAALSYTMSAAQWDTHWQDYINEGTALYMAPGSNPAQMNFAWLGSGETDMPIVYVRPVFSLSAYLAFTGEKVQIEDSSVFSYQVTVTGLEPNTLYSYYYSADGVDSEIDTFKTAQADSFSAIYVSDVHVSESESDPDNVKNTSFALHEIFAEAYSKDNDVSIILSGGDQANDGTLFEYMGVFSSPIIKNIPLATTCGNHDNKENVYSYVTNNPNVYNDGLAVSPDRNGGDYYFVKGDVLFLFMNSNWCSALDHRNFAAQAVEANPDVKWRVVVMHHDLYGGHIESRENENKLLRMMFVPIFDEFAIDLVFTGHSHVFSRSHVMYDDKIATDITANNHVTDANGTIYITSGSTCRPRGDVSAGSDAVAFDYISGDDLIYNIVDFSYDTITIDSYAKGSGAPFEVFTLEKTTNEGGHPNEGYNETYNIIGIIGMIVNEFNKISFILEKFFLSIGIEF